MLVRRSRTVDLRCGPDRHAGRTDPITVVEIGQVHALRAAGVVVIGAPLEMSSPVDTEIRHRLLITRFDAAIMSEVIGTLTGGGRANTRKLLQCIDFSSYFPTQIP